MEQRGGKKSTRSSSMDPNMASKVVHLLQPVRSISAEIGCNIDPKVLDKLYNNEEYKNKALPSLPAPSKTIQERSEDVYAALKKMSFLKDPAPPKPTNSPRTSSLLPVESQRIDTLLKTIHNQEREIESLKAQLAQETQPKESSTTEQGQNGEQVELLKALCTKLTQELKKSFIALKIAHSQLQTERRKNMELTEQNSQLQASPEEDETSSTPADLYSLRNENMRLLGRIRKLEQNAPQSPSQSDEHFLASDD